MSGREGMLPRNSWGTAGTAGRKTIRAEDRLVGLCFAVFSVPLVFVRATCPLLPALPTTTAGFSPPSYYPSACNGMSPGGGEMPGSSVSARLEELATMLRNSFEGLNTGTGRAAT